MIRVKLFILIFSIIALVCGICYIKELKKLDGDPFKVDFGDLIILSYGAYLMTPASIGCIIVILYLTWR